MTTKIAQDQVQNLKSRPLAEVIADTKLSLGDEVTISDRANGVFDVVLSSTVTENTFNIVQCTGVPTLSLELRVSGTALASQIGAVGVADGALAINAVLPLHLSVELDDNITIATPIIMNTFYSLTASGIGTTVTCSDNTKNALEFQSNVRNTLVEGIAFNSSNGTGNCFEYDAANGGEKQIVRDCYVNNFNRAFNAGNIWWGNRIDNVRVNTCVNALYIAGSGLSIQNLITNFYPNNCTGIGIYLNGCKGTTFVDLNVGADFVGANQYMVLENNAMNVTVIGGNFENSGSLTISPDNGGILIQSGSSATFVEPTFTGNVGASATGYEIRIKDTARVSIKNPTFVSQGANMGNFLVSDTAVVTTEGYTGVVTSTSTAQQVHLNNMASSVASYDANGIVLAGLVTAHAAGANILTGLGVTPVWYMVQLITTGDTLPTVQAHITGVDISGNIKIRYTNLSDGTQNFSAHDIIWAVR